ncbi:hypothetical protein [Labrys miyagiensis]|uniref:hypothetical protein n=1 Tax=Labrys miyagiensis TaxID=346912 RepID=UPI0024E18C12|nr:hypothetical protein [Labrys miyagiensis]
MDRGVAGIVIMKIAQNLYHRIIRELPLRRHRYISRRRTKGHIPLWNSATGILWLAMLMLNVWRK